MIRLFYLTDCPSKSRKRSFSRHLITFSSSGYGFFSSAIANSLSTAKIVLARSDANGLDITERLDRVAMQEDRKRQYIKSSIYYKAKKNHMKPFEATRLLPDQGRSLRSHCKQLCNLKDFTFSSWRVCCVLSLPQTVFIALRSFSALYCSSALDSDGARSTSP